MTCLVFSCFQYCCKNVAGSSNSNSSKCNKRSNSCSSSSSNTITVTIRLAIAVAVKRIVAICGNDSSSLSTLDRQIW